AVHARREIVALRSLLQMTTVERGEQVEIAALIVGRCPRRRLQIEDGRSLRSERRPLIARGQESAPPVRRAAPRIRHFGQHYEPRQIAILAAESVGHPRADRWTAAKAIAGVDVVQCGRMIDRLGLQPAIEAEIIRDAAQMLPIDTNVGAALAGLAK